MGSFFELSILFLSWSAYLAAHSFLAGLGVKRWVESRFPGSGRRYRLVYSIVSVVTLLPIGWLIATSDAGLAFAKSETLKYLGFILGSWGTFIISLAFRQVSLKVFLGVEEGKENTLVRSGILSKIRHPIYSGIIVLMVGMVLAVASWAVIVSALAILCYLPVGIFLEEQKLIGEFGADYRRYKEEVPALIPRLF